METNPRGIPRAPFVEKVEDFIGNDTSEILLKKFNETLFTYKRMESNLQNRKRSLCSKIPELEKSWEVVKALLMNKNRVSPDTPMKCKYELADSLYANASIEAVDKVGVWLGANVMLEYKIEEAQQLLCDKLEAARNSLKVVNEDILFLREQITTIEVNIARVYNWDVKKRKTNAELTV